MPVAFKTEKIHSEICQCRQYCQKAIPFNVHIPPVDEAFEGVGQKQFLRCYACRLPLIIAIFLRGKVKNCKFLRGVLCQHFDLFSKGLKIFKAHPQGVWISFNIQ